MMKAMMTAKRAEDINEKAKKAEMPLRKEGSSLNSY
jgi:hypothetical protein